MWRGSALIGLAGILSCTGRPDAQPASEADAQPAAETAAQPAERSRRPGPAAGPARHPASRRGLGGGGRPRSTTGRTWTFRDSTLATAADGKADQQGTVSIDSTASPARRTSTVGPERASCAARSTGSPTIP